jgi:UDP-N-acetylmuramate dehydrogenase
VFFAGIPGVVGGALAMNAGAFGGETWRNVESVRE